MDHRAAVPIEPSGAKTTLSHAWMILLRKFSVAELLTGQNLFVEWFQLIRQDSP